MSVTMVHNIQAAQAVKADSIQVKENQVPQTPKEAAKIDTQDKAVFKVLKNVGKHAVKTGAGILAGSAFTTLAVVTPLAVAFNGAGMGGAVAAWLVMGASTLSGTVAGNIAKNKMTAIAIGAGTGAAIGAWGGSAVGPAGIACGAAIGAIGGAASAFASSVVFQKK